MTSAPAPRADAEIPAFIAGLGLPGLADIHIHFLPERMLEKVWAVFDNAADVPAQAGDGRLAQWLEHGLRCGS